MPHPLRHGPTVNNGHILGPVILTPTSERLAVNCHLSCMNTRCGNKTKESYFNFLIVTIGIKINTLSTLLLYDHECLSVIFTSNQAY